MDLNWTPYSDDFEKFISRITLPSVVIENSTCSDSTVVTVDCARKDEILVEALQVLADLNLSIKKANISSDGRWFMAVFHVTDANGNKLADRSVISNIEESLGAIHNTRVLGVEDSTTLELMGNDRVGLLSEIFAVLSDLACHVVEAKVWTHNGRIAMMIHVKESNPACQMLDSDRISAILARLRPVLMGGPGDDVSSIKSNVSLGDTHPERRLHQMLFADRDFERAPTSVRISDPVVVTAQNLKRWGYSLVNVRCRDRMKLPFDAVCALADMGYVVFHATVNTTRNRAHLDFYIRHKDGTPISSDAEQERVIQCLKAAIERRTSQGLRLELSIKDHPWLLADVTRTFRENGLNVTRAEIFTSKDMAVHTFYVTGSEGFLPDSKAIDNIKEKIGSGNLKVKELSSEGKNKEGVGVLGNILISLGSIVSKSLSNSIGFDRVGFFDSRWRELDA